MAYLKYLFRLVALSCTLLPGFGTEAQNLVPNSGFESYFEDPELSVNGVNATADWFKFEYTTEFFHRTYPQVSLSEQSGYMTDDFGAMLLQERPEQDSLSKYYYVVKNQEGRVLSDTSGWMEIRGQYLAQGGEQYLLIGNLYGQTQTTFQETAVEDSRFWAYYFVDQVAAIPNPDARAVRR